ncbi:MAG: hypothetical protein B0D92_01350 [Spirochaeta sp. LUC14_002_19_P3]|nr:MAG: hypothetical protein B0D92_01350 [Spirochaeta sp. LUC14_002_19_P3]
MTDNTTEKILKLMDEINRIPRQSHHLEKIHPWLMNWGKEKGFEVRTDAAHNILYKVPASPGYESAPTLVLQGHMDMVCEKRPGVEHDFQNDPIVSWRDGDWLKAKGTSLGADNAIALAMIFALITEEKAEHPALEVLITSDEETGLVGAQNLEPDFLEGRVLLNIDSEDEGVFTIGCAGGMDVNLTLPVECAPLPEGFETMELTIGGLEGGHSGIEIILQRACANELLVRVLRAIVDAVPDVRFGGLCGGSAHNAIPRDACALIAVSAKGVSKVKKVVEEMEAVSKAEYAQREKNLRFTLGAAKPGEGGLFTPESGGKLLDALKQIPHGVKFMSYSVPGAADTSLNFAMLRTEAAALKVLTNIRSARASRGASLAESMYCLARLCGGSGASGNHYPAWEPRPDSALLARAKTVWKKLSGEEAEVEVTHAGLECGAIGSHYPDMEMISFGPTIRQPHSPDERLFIPSVGRVYAFMKELVKS